jgi:ABC-type antimicrobial peptide transport system permease subunit
MLVAGVRAALVGIAGGIALALVIGRSVSTLLVGIEPTDVRTYLGVSLTIALLTALASSVPARRAGRIDPMQALRTE